MVYVGVDPSPFSRACFEFSVEADTDLNKRSVGVMEVLDQSLLTVSESPQIGGREIGRCIMIPVTVISFFTVIRP